MKALSTFRVLLIVALSFTTSNAFPPAEARLLGSLGDPDLRPPVPASRELRPDQVNTAGWDKAWTNLGNEVEHSFRPSMPRLLAVEVELIVGNDGESQDDLTLSVKNAEGDELVSVTQVVKTADCEHMLFVFPE